MSDFSLDDALRQSDYYENVGPTNAGTYNVPASAQPVNTQWDSAGGILGQYGDDVFGILSAGIGAWSRYKTNEQMLDYRRYEATAGGLYPMGRPNGGAVVGVSAQGISPLMLVLIVGGAFLLLRR